MKYDIQEFAKKSLQKSLVLMIQLFIISIKTEKKSFYAELS